MKTLNLVYPEKSDIKYRIDKFPDGQQNIVIEPTPEKLSLDKLSEFFNNIPSKKDDILIKSRLNNWLDLELITCAVASLRELGVEEIHLYTPYIMGARSDRKFEEGGNNYLRDVICPVINSLNFKTVTCIDPHSDVLEACIKGFRKESNLDLVKWVFMNHPQNTKPVEDFILVSPDAGASKKIYKLAEQIGYKGDIITCSKDRDIDGKLTMVNVPIAFDAFTSKKADFIIIDDICDGGATFINIAKNLKNRVKGKIYLIVTHSIFSKGFEELSRYFDGIYCTNSYSDVEKQFKPFKEINGYSKDFVKQLDIF
jgi:ribose-phosphate pyrophosphokinase